MRVLAVALLAAALAVGAFLARGRESERDRKLGEVRSAAAARAIASVERLLDADRKRLEGQVSLVAANDLLRRGVATDAATINDMVASEGLRSLREHQVYAIGRPELADLPELHLLHGIDRVSIDVLAAHPVVRGALANTDGPPVSGLLRLPNGVAVVAASSVLTHDRTIQGWVLLGDPLDGAALARLAHETQTALVLSDGAIALASASGIDGIDAGSLAPAIGTEGQYMERALLPDVAGGTLGVRVLSLVNGTSLWVAGSAASETVAVQAAHDASNATGWAAVLGVGLLAAVGVLLLDKRRTTAAPAPAQAATDPSTSDSQAWATGQTPPQPPMAPTAPGSLPSRPGGAPPLAVSQTQGGRVGATQPFAGAPGLPSNPPPADPLVFGRYKLVERLGAGGMAEVWTAVLFGAEGFARPFVVKRIRGDLAGNADLVQQFIDEANLASRLVHGNVVPVFDFGRLGDEYFLAQEYILGRDLGKVVQALSQRGRRLDPQLALYVAVEVAKALDYAHTQHDPSGRSMGIVHRDVSPNNVLASQRGEVKLIDFGIAKSVGKVAQTEVGTVKGNVRFMAPEQARGEVTDGRTDLFSLGVTLFYALRGEPLYSATNPYELLLAAAKGPTAVEMGKIQHLPAPLDSLVARLLQPDPAHRFPSAAAMIEALAPFVPADGPRRLASLVAELFAEDLARQQKQFESAVSTIRAGATSDASGSQAVDTEDATIQRPAPKAPPTGRT